MRPVAAYRPFSLEVVTNTSAGRSHADLEFFSIGSCLASTKWVCLLLTRQHHCFLLPTIRSRSFHEAEVDMSRADSASSTPCRSCLDSLCIASGHGFSKGTSNFYFCSRLTLLQSGTLETLSAPRHLPRWQRLTGWDCCSEVKFPNEVGCDLSKTQSLSPTPKRDNAGKKEGGGCRHESRPLGVALANRKAFLPAERCDYL